MEDVLGIFMVFVLLPGMILGYILLSRYLKYRETMAMIEHGITPPQPPPVVMPTMSPQPPIMVNRGQGGTGRGMLIWGLVLSGVGLALTLALWPIGFIANSASGDTVNFPLGLGPWMLAGFTPLFVGLALILAFVIMRPERPAPLPAREGGNGGAYSSTPSGHGPFVSTEAIRQQEGQGAPPGTPAP